MPTIIVIHFDGILIERLLEKRNWNVSILFAVRFCCSFFLRPQRINFHEKLSWNLSQNNNDKPVVLISISFSHLLTMNERCIHSVTVSVLSVRLKSLTSVDWNAKCLFDLTCWSSCLFSFSDGRLFFHAQSVKSFFLVLITAWAMFIFGRAKEFHAFRFRFADDDNKKAELTRFLLNGRLSGTFFRGFVDD